MQIVIDIPDKCYNFFKKGWENTEININHSFATILFKSVSTGIPLPKGHGDLIDRNEAEKIAAKKFEHITSPLLNHIQTYDAYNIIRSTPTVIEATAEREVEE